MFGTKKVSLDSMVQQDTETLINGSHHGTDIAGVMGTTEGQCGVQRVYIRVSDLVRNGRG